MTKEQFKKNKTIRFVLISFFLLVVALLLPPHRNQTINFTQGMVWVEPDLIATYPIPIYKDHNVFLKEKKFAAENVSPIFNEKTLILFDVNLYNDFFKDLYRTLADILAKKTPVNDLEKFNIYSPNEQKLLLDDYKKRLITRDDKKSFIYVFEKTFPFHIHTLLNNGIINISKKSITSTKIIVHRSGFPEKQVPLNFIKDSTEMIQAFKDIISQIPFSTSDNHESVFEIGLQLASPFLKPTLLYDENETKSSLSLINTNIPIAEGVINENEIIVSKGQVITAEISKKIDSYIKTKTERDETKTLIGIYVGRLLIVFSICLLFALYLSIFFHLFLDNIKLLLIILSILIPMLITWAATYYWLIPPYIVPIGVFALLLSISIDARISFISVITIALLTALVRGGDFSFAISIAVSGCGTVLFITNLKQRRQIIVASLITFLGYVLVIVAFEFSKLTEFDVMLHLINYALLGALANFLVYPLLLIVEKVFRITTDFTLLELADLSHPLIKRLSKETIGTYHHSLQMSVLSEEAANSIGANALLCRVGAYFHDIGKLEHPDYFYENQRGFNPHETIGCEESSAIIISHVSKGIELAKKYKLPDEIINFIPEHHGTTIIRFFYEEAVKQLPSEKLNRNNFCYPGPKPQTKETAIVMLADAIEASVRSLTIINEENVNLIVDSILQQRLDDNQFSDCTIMFSELQTIKQSFVNSVINSQHKRIKYPKQTL